MTVAANGDKTGRGRSEGHADLVRVTLANHAGGASLPWAGDQAEFLHLRSNLIFVPAEEARDLRHRPAVGDFVR